MRKDGALMVVVTRLELKLEVRAVRLGTEVMARSSKELSSALQSSILEIFQSCYFLNAAF